MDLDAAIDEVRTDQVIDQDDDRIAPDKKPDGIKIVSDEDEIGDAGQDDERHTEDRD